MVSLVVSVLWQELLIVATLQGLSEIAGCAQRCEESCSKKTSGLASSAWVHCLSTGFGPTPHVGPVVGCPARLSRLARISVAEANSVII